MLLVSRSPHQEQEKSMPDIKKKKEKKKRENINKQKYEGNFNVLLECAKSAAVFFFNAYQN